MGLVDAFARTAENACTEEMPMRTALFFHHCPKFSMLLPWCHCGWGSMYRKNEKAQGLVP